ncbi:uncharacterized protein MONOS_13665 [Monocercomonoides exilis]|uniref:uncharacterized protein n=1 Tax=Monocercomonoides exilis TaxID=2049356 RepID=UPI00355A00ED|nr:hypothetical protein MONOS_13665 [Monocercomonoides exilis]|eukprot:MONOS_13665.1-p1 / transcript=MONOS_13665.1 / gene=MONOS_13665 / organism=Monocercomonoides_exilis_PA203 / gene_product=unspecified product / transcript_product=unspecified product / location=Mono_scaffold00860:18209-18631(-) / protein_length=125 / sequence_SO=supercontig / SO=protein_coding / is_pseudo=false
MEKWVEDKGSFLGRVETAGGEETKAEIGEREKGKLSDKTESEISNSKIYLNERKSELPDSAHSAAVSAMLCFLEELMLSEEEKWRLRFVATGAMWINVDGLLSLFGLTRRDILKQNEVNTDEVK